MRTTYLSILGSPSSGKSYFLGTMTWQLRKHLADRFAVSFGDAEPHFNGSLTDYENTLFHPAEPDELVVIRKTELQGDLYNTVLYGNQSVSYPKPFLFAVRPLPDHPHYELAERVSRAICLYDKAGEHFQPGFDTVGSPATQHLARSEALFFLFDPTQDHRFRQACRGISSDPQLVEAARTARQETVLLEAANRVRRYSGLKQHTRHDRPLIVIVTKYDAWSHLLGQKMLEERDFMYVGNSRIASVNHAVVDDVSTRLRRVLQKYSPEIVAAAEGFADEVVYFPVSALGGPPEVDPRSGGLCVRPGNVEPKCVEIPLAYTLSRWLTGLIPYVRSKPKQVLQIPTHDAAPARSADPPHSIRLPRRHEGRS